MRLVRPKSPVVELKRFIQPPRAASYTPSKKAREKKSSYSILILGRTLLLHINLSQILLLRNIASLRLSRSLSRTTLLRRLRRLFLLGFFFLSNRLLFLLLLFALGAVLGLLLLGGWGAWMMLGTEVQWRNRKEDGSVIDSRGEMQTFFFFFLFAFTLAFAFLGLFLGFALFAFFSALVTHF